MDCREAFRLYLLNVSTFFLCCLYYVLTTLFLIFYFGTVNEFLLCACACACAGAVYGTYEAIRYKVKSNIYFSFKRWNHFGCVFTSILVDNLPLLSQVVMKNLWIYDSYFCKSYMEIWCVLIFFFFLGDSS